MALSKKDLLAIRDEIDLALEDKADDAMGDVRELATQVEWLRRDFDLHTVNLKRHTALVRSLVVKFDELRQTVKKLRKVND